MIHTEMSVQVSYFFPLKKYVDYVGFRDTDRQKCEFIQEQ